MAADPRRYEFEESFEGAVDIVFLLIIFFLVASSLTQEITEKISLPRRQTKTKQTEQIQQKKEFQRVNIVVYDNSKVKVNDEYIELEDPTSTEVYRKVRAMLEEELGPVDELEAASGEEPTRKIEILIQTDRKSYSGTTLHCIMACLDLRQTPKVLFEKDLSAEEAEQ